MKSTFEDMKAVCFDGHPVLHAYYGEQPDAGLLASILRPHALELVTSKATVAKIAKRRIEKGEFPILQMVYQLRFTDHVPPELFTAYLNQSTVKLESARYDLRCWFIGDRHTLMGALNEFCRCMPRKNLSHRGDHGVNYTFAIRPGECIATFATLHVDPLRNVMVA